MTDTSNYTWNYNDFDNYNEYIMDDYVFDHTNIFVLNRKKNAMELRHDLMAMYIYIVILFTFWLVNYFLEISSPEYRVYVNELAYNRFGMRIYDRLGVEDSDSDSEGETEEETSESEDDDTYSESDSEEETDTEPDEASEEEDSDTDYEVDISNYNVDPTAGCFRLD